MRCNDFDAHIDEMLSGILHPDANHHMRQCERCSSHLRSRATVQNGLRQLASATLPGPSRATDRAVMDGFRRLQQRRAPAAALQNISQAASRNASQKPRVLTFPSRGLAPGGGSRNWMTSAAAAAVVFAVLGSAVHLWNGVPTVNAPTTAPAVATASAPASSAPNPALRASAAAPRHFVVPVNLSTRRGLQHPAQLSSQSNDSQSTAPQSNASLSPMLTADAGANPSAAPLAPLPASAAPFMHLANSSAALGATGGMTGSLDQSASSTWPGYSNLMYCDPVVCSGPMEVVHIKVPIGQVKPNLGQTVGNGFVNAEVVVGPDGVARAIRVAN